VDKSSSEYQFVNYVDAITFPVRKIWSHSTSATGSYGKQADKIVLNLEFFKIKNIQAFAMFNKGTVLL